MQGIGASVRPPCRTTGLDFRSPFLRPGYLRGSDGALLWAFIHERGRIDNDPLVFSAGDLAQFVEGRDLEDEPVFVDFRHDAVTVTVIPMMVGFW